MEKAMKRTMIDQTSKMVGKKVRVCGWVNARRDHRKLVFIDLRDRSGLVQVVGEKKLADLRISDIVEIEGTVRKRPKELINPKIVTGELESIQQRLRKIDVGKALEIFIESNKQYREVAVVTLDEVKAGLGFGRKAYLE